MQQGSSITTGTTVSEVQRSRGASVFFRISLAGLLVIGAVTGLAWLGVLGNSVSAGATVPVVDDTLGTFADAGQSLGSAKSYGVALGDLDGDGNIDAFVVNYPGAANKVWTNNGSGTFTDSGQSLGSAFSYGVALGDLDGDGDLDAFVVNYGQANKVWLGQGHLDIWYLAEGYTGSGFSTFILIMNPNSTAAAVQVTYMLDSGTNITKTHTVAANSRYTITAGQDEQAGSDQAFGTKLVSSRSIVVERAMYWGTDGGHVTAGIRG